MKVPLIATINQRTIDLRDSSLKVKTQKLLSTISEEKKIRGCCGDISLIKADANMAGAVFFLKGSKIILYFITLFLFKNFLTNFK